MQRLLGTLGTFQFFRVNAVVMGSTRNIDRGMFQDLGFKGFLNPTGCVGSMKEIRKGHLIGGELAAGFGAVCRRHPEKSIEWALYILYVFWVLTLFVTGWGLGECIKVRRCAL